MFLCLAVSLAKSEPKLYLANYSHSQSHTGVYVVMYILLHKVNQLLEKY